MEAALWHELPQRRLPALKPQTRAPPCARHQALLAQHLCLFYAHHAMHARL